MEQQARRTPPSKLWYVAGVAILVGGIGGAVWYGVTTVIGSIDDMQRFVVPGEHELELAAGDHTLYYERTSTVNGVAYHTERVVSLQCGLRFGQEPIEMRAPSMNETYTMGSRSGASVAAFTADQKGTYTLDCAHEDGPVVVAVGDAFSFKVIIIAIVMAFLGLIAGAVTIALTYQRRLNAMNPPPRPPPAPVPNT
jgi:hypothetical protein